MSHSIELQANKQIITYPDLSKYVSTGIDERRIFSSLKDIAITNLHRIAHFVKELFLHLNREWYSNKKVLKTLETNFKDLSKKIQECSQIPTAQHEFEKMERIALKLSLDSSIQGPADILRLQIRENIQQWYPKDSSFNSSSSSFLISSPSLSSSQTSSPSSSITTGSIEIIKEKIQTLIRRADIDMPPRDTRLSDINFEILTRADNANTITKTLEAIKIIRENDKNNEKELALKELEDLIRC